MTFLVNKKPKPVDSLPDADIINEYRQTKSAELIGVLFDRYAHLVLGIAAKYINRPDDRKEIVMQVFDKLYDALIQFEIGNFKAWLYSVAKNQCLIMLKKETQSKTENALMLKNFQDDFMENDHSFYLMAKEQDFLENKLMQKIQALQTEQRICVELFYLEQKSYKQIVEITNFEINQVKSYIQNGKRNLKIMLESK